MITDHHSTTRHKLLKVEFILCLLLLPVPVVVAQQYDGEVKVQLKAEVEAHTTCRNLYYGAIHY